MLIYFDNIIITSSHASIISYLISTLQHKFPLNDLGPLSYFLDIQATHTFIGLHLSQTKYITDPLHCSCMLGAKPIFSPCTSGSKLSSHTGETLSNPTAYHQVVGSLQYCTLTHPNIAFSVTNFVNTCTHPPPYTRQQLREC